MFTWPKPRTALLCGLLLSASVILYMDRQTLANLGPQIQRELELDNEEYGRVEEVFGLAFAFGSLVFGFVADSLPVRWLYPLFVLGWSAAGALTGFSSTFVHLLACRLMLGLFEAGHWPCAMQTTRRALAVKDRALGNSVLQSGVSIGAILTPLIILGMQRMQGMQGNDPPLGSWRAPFVVLGALGVLWAAGWFLTVRPRDLQVRDEDLQSAETTVWQELRSLVRDRRFWVLAVIVISINTMWQFFRSWLPFFLERGRGYSSDHQKLFTMAYYLATDVGCLGAGIATKWLSERGWSVFASRRVVFTACAVLAGACLTLPWLPRGPLLLGVWLVMGMGALGVFPCYYSFTQDLSVRHPAKVFGLLRSVAWLTTSPLHPLYGKWVDALLKAGNPHAYDYGLMGVGVLPMMASLGLWLVWREPAANEAPKSRSADGPDA